MSKDFSKVQPGEFLGENLTAAEWKLIKKIGAEKNGHVVADDEFANELRCEICDARVRFQNFDEDDGRLFNWYETGYLTKKCISPEDRKWLFRSAAEIVASIGEITAEAKRRGLSAGSIQWAMDRSRLYDLMEEWESNHPPPTGTMRQHNESQTQAGEVEGKSRSELRLAFARLRCAAIAISTRLARLQAWRSE